MVTKSESATFHRKVEFAPLATQESAVKERTFGHGGGTYTGLTLTTAVLVIVCVEQLLLVTVSV